MISGVSMPMPISMPMGGAHAMAMAWAPGMGAITFGRAAGFVVGWTAMMAAMMLPSLVPTLRRFHRVVSGARTARPARLTTIAVAAYLAVWGAAGVAVYLVEAGVASVHASLPAGAAALGIAFVVIVAGVWQFSAWKSRHLDCCRALLPRGGTEAAGAPGAWWYGVRLGWHCLNSSAALTMILLVVGLMDLRAMAAVTAAITAERLAPASVRVARILGAAGVCAGLVLVARAVAMH